MFSAMNPALLEFHQTSKQFLCLQTNGQNLTSEREVTSTNLLKDAARSMRICMRAHARKQLNNQEQK